MVQVRKDKTRWVIAAESLPLLFSVSHIPGTWLWHYTQVYDIKVAHVPGLKDDGPAERRRVGIPVCLRQ